MASAGTRWTPRNHGGFSMRKKMRMRRNGAPVLLDSEEEEDDNTEQKLIRTGPRVDSFDVEALEVPGVLRNDYEFSKGKLGVKFKPFSKVTSTVGPVGAILPWHKLASDYYCG